MAEQEMDVVDEAVDEGGKSKRGRVVRTLEQQREDAARKLAEIEQQLAEKQARKRELTVEARSGAAEQLYELLGIEPIARDRSERRRAAALVERVTSLLGDQGE